MALSIAQLRSQIADRPQTWPPMVQPPELIGQSDGVATIFSLRFENFIPGTLTILTTPLPTSDVLAAWTAISPSAYTVGAPDPGPDSTGATNALITFNAAPAAGLLVGARYQVVAFSDAEISDLLTSALALYGGNDQLVRKAVQYDAIDRILMDQDRLTVLTEGTYKRDPQAFLNGLIKLKAALRTDLEGMPVAGTSVPTAAIAISTPRRYGPMR